MAFQCQRPSVRLLSPSTATYVPCKLRIREAAGHFFESARIVRQLRGPAIWPPQPAEPASGPLRRVFVADVGVIRDATW